MQSLFSCPVHPPVIVAAVHFINVLLPIKETGRSSREERGQCYSRHADAVG